LPASAAAFKEQDGELADCSFATLKVGQQLSGVVTRTLAFGAFVDIGAEREGLVPLSKMSDKRVDDVDDFVKIGQSVTVWVSSKDMEASPPRLQLSMSKNKILSFPRSTLDVGVFKDMSSDDWVEGQVQGLQSFGAFVALKDPNGGTETAQGLLPISQIAEERVENIADYLTPGQMIKVRVEKVDMEAKRMALSMKDVPCSVEEFAGVDPETWLTGTVSGTAAFGAFVALPHPKGGPGKAQGLVPMNQLAGTDFVADIKDVVKFGDEVKVRVLSVQDGKLGLTMKELGAPANKREEMLLQFKDVEADKWLQGKVKNFADFGAFVEVMPPGGEGEPVDGLVHISQISEEKVDDPQEVLEEGQDVMVRVLQLENGKMSLSMVPTEGSGPVPATA